METEACREKYWSKLVIVHDLPSQYEKELEKTFRYHLKRNGWNLVGWGKQNEKIVKVNHYICRLTIKEGSTRYKIYAKFSQSLMTNSSFVMTTPDECSFLISKEEDYLPMDWVAQLIEKRFNYYRPYRYVPTKGCASRYPFKRMVIISDTHSSHHKFRWPLPAADFLVCCGDFANRCSHENQIIDFNEWLGTLSQIKHKVVIAGNQEFLFNGLTAPQIQAKWLTNCHYLQDSGVEIEGISFWGSPWQPSQGMAFSFPYRRLSEKWAKIPTTTDVLITHEPPRGILDLAGSGKLWGCEALKERVRKVAPRLHCFGHVHEGYGHECHQGTTFINAASSLNIHHQKFLRKPMVVDVTM